MRIAVMIALSAALGACASIPSEPPGPNSGEMSALVADAASPAPVVRDVRCDFIADEGSEWTCVFEQQAGDGRWVRRETAVARDGGQWILIDGVTPAAS